MIAAWGAQKVIEREDDARRPLPDLTVDVSSRYALAQLVLRNVGGTPAFDVRIHWDTPLLNSKGNTVSFSERADDVAAVILPNDERVTAFIDAVSSLVKRNETIYSGKLTYAERPGGKRKTHEFTLDLESIGRHSSPRMSCREHSMNCRRYRESWTASVMSCNRSGRAWGLLNTTAIQDRTLRGLYSQN